MTPLKIKITVRNKALEMQVLEQDERLRGVGEIFNNHDYILASAGDPELTEMTCYIRGCVESHDDNIAMRSFTSNTDRDAYLARVKKLMSDFKRAWKAGKVEVGR